MNELEKLAWLIAEEFVSAYESLEVLLLDEIEDTVENEKPAVRVMIAKV